MAVKVVRHLDYGNFFVMVGSRCDGEKVSDGEMGDVG